MQAIPYNFSDHAYNWDMPIGRPPTKPRTPLGERIAEARRVAGLSQIQLADKLETTQRVVSYWEREPVALKPDQLTALADALGTSADFLLGRETSTGRGKGPAGKARRVFEAVSKLPRKQQEKIFDVIEPFISSHSKAS
jgi:transcriptional regulator with XRE-family HTH domain